MRILFRNGILVYLLFTLLSFGMTGCGPSTGELKVTGKITIDGQPIPEGGITFEDENRSIAVGGGNIKDGVYSAKVLPGKKKVKVNGTSDFTDEELQEQMKKYKMIIQQKKHLVPEKYMSDDTPLEATIEKSCVLDFELTSK